MFGCNSVLINLPLIFWKKYNPVEVVFELFKLAIQSRNYVRTVNFLLILRFVRIIEAHFGVIYIIVSTIPYKSIDMLLYSFFL